MKKQEYIKAVNEIDELSKQNLEKQAEEYRSNIREIVFVLLIANSERVYSTEEIDEYADVILANMVEFAEKQTPNLDNEQLVIKKSHFVEVLRTIQHHITFGANPERTKDFINDSIKTVNSVAIKHTLNQ